MDRPQTPLGSWQACLSAAGRPVVASLWPVRSLPPLFIWASEGDVRHFGPPSKASRQPAGLFAGSLWPVRSLQPPLFFWASEGDVRHFGPPPKSLSAAGRPASSLGLSQACLFFLMAGLPATLGLLDRPQTPLGSWQACLFSSYGL